MSDGNNDLQWTPGHYDEAAGTVNVDGDIRPVHGMQHAKDTHAAGLLLSEMSRISEDCWCASWLSDLDKLLWTIVEKGAAGAWGAGEVTAVDIAFLSELRRLAGGWWHWPRPGTETELTFYPVTP